MEPIRFPACNIVDGVDTVIAVWASTGATEYPLTASGATSGVTNAVNGYEIELDKCGQANAAPGTQSPSAAPYGTLLRPITDLSRLVDVNNERVVLVQLQWLAIDSTRLKDDAGSYQNNTVLTDLFNSLDAANPNNAFMQSRFKNSLVGGWWPNWFRPVVRVNGREILYEALSRSGFPDTPNHAGDLSMGLPLPHCIEGEFNLGRVSTIELWAQAGQLVGGLIQRYPIMAVGTFLRYNQ